MALTDKERAVELACACLNTIGRNQTAIHKPLSASDVDSILRDCYNSILSLEDFDDK